MICEDGPTITHRPFSPDAVGQDMRVNALFQPYRSRDLWERHTLSAQDELGHFSTNGLRGKVSQAYEFF